MAGGIVRGSTEGKQKNLATSDPDTVRRMEDSTAHVCGKAQRQGKRNKKKKRKGIKAGKNRELGENGQGASESVTGKEVFDDRLRNSNRKRKVNSLVEDKKQPDGVHGVLGSEKVTVSGDERQGKKVRKRKKRKGNEAVEDKERAEYVVQSGSENVREASDKKQPDGVHGVLGSEKVIVSGDERQGKKVRKRRKRKGNEEVEDKERAEYVVQSGSENVREASAERDTRREEVMGKPKLEKNKNGGKAHGEIFVVKNGTQEVTELNDEMVARSVETLDITREKPKKEVVLVESEFKDVEEPSVDMDVTSAKKRLNYVVHVKRPDDVEKGRENLPIVMMEQEIMEAVLENAVVIVCGETGCGKTTQVPQFLFEAGYGSGLNNERGGMIGVTQPRRVAVLGTARRVAHELNVQLGQEVGFQVRHDRKLGEKCSIKFMTDGILLRELQGDFLLRKYSAIVLDEAHERSLNTDILIGMLSRIVPLRQKLHDQQMSARKKQKVGSSDQEARDPNVVTPLKLVIMSATLRVEDFTANTRMFPTPPPVMRVPARQFPVSVHFSKKTELIDYMGAAYKKVCAIHRKLPAGGILVFLTGQREVEDLCRKLRKAFQPVRNKGSRGAPSDASDPKGLVGGEQVGEANMFGGLNIDKISAAMDDDAAVNGKNCSEKNDDDASGDELFGNLTESEDESDLELSEDETLRQEDVLERIRQTLYSTDAKPGIDLADKLPNEKKGSSSSAKGLSDLTKENAHSAGVPPNKQKDSSSQDFGVKELSTKETNSADPVISKQMDSSSPPFGLKDLTKEETLVNPTRKSDKGEEPGPLHVLPLYAMLPAAAQLKVFGDMPKGKRFVVVATNVAETSITIPGIKYVVDCGRAKENEFDRSSGISKFEVQWINKASADQRAGRAGRTGPGHCYRLYSSAHFSHSFPTFGRPEILKSPIEGVVLVMKCMGIDKVTNFPFPTPPDRTAVVEAEKCLKSLSALNLQTGLLTPIGQAIAVYPISPRHSRMLLAAVQEAQELRLKIGEADVSLALAYAIAVAAALSLDDPFLREAGITEEEEVQASEPIRGVHYKSTCDASGTERGEVDVFHPNADQREDWMVAAEKAKRKVRRGKAASAHWKFRNVSSDAISVANALRAYDQALNREEFCQTHYLHSKTMAEMSKLRKQLKELIITNISESKIKLGAAEATKGVDLICDGDLIANSEIRWHEPPEKKLTQLQEALIRRAICAGWADKVSRKLSLQERAAIPDADRKRKVVAYRGCSTEEPIFLHPTSAVSKEAPDFVVYNELVNTSRIYMQRVTAVESSWLVRQAEALCTFSKPLSDPPPWYDPFADEVMCWVTPTFGPHLWELPLHKVALKKGKHRTAVFATALLQGKVLPVFSSLQSCLTNDPNIILKPESQALKRVGDMLHRLTTQIVDTRAKLRDCWTKDAHFLYPEIMSWVQSNHQAKVKDIWERLRQQALLNGEELFRRSKR